MSVVKANFEIPPKNAAISGGGVNLDAKIRKGVKGVWTLISPNKNKGETHFEKVK